MQLGQRCSFILQCVSYAYPLIKKKNPLVGDLDVLLEYYGDQYEYINVL